MNILDTYEIIYYKVNDKDKYNINFNYINNCTVYYRNGKIHRDNDLPSVIYENNTQQEWYQNGELHRDNDLPAIINEKYGRQEWFKNGKRHRDNNQPAFIYKNGTQHWYKNGIVYKSKSK